MPRGDRPHHHVNDRAHPVVGLDGVTISFARHHFPPAIIRRAVWLCARFTLSYRVVEDLLAERDLDVSYETVPAMGFEVRAVVRPRTSPSTPAANIAMASR